MLLTVQGCARLRTGPIIIKSLKAIRKKSLLCRKSAILSIRWKKTRFGVFPEAKKGVVNGARLRKAGHWPNNNANPPGLSNKKVNV